ncbi:MAG: ABC transporter permease subunit [Gemmatimonadota bacterium]|nr:ABC transporter permease subunit [Gemmatimonadota bacterium]
MLSNIIIREIHQHILSLRLHLTLILVLLLFGIGTLAFVKSHEADRERYEQYYAELLEGAREQAENNLTRYMVDTRSLILAPRSNAFISGAREKHLPTQFWYSGYNVFGFDVPGGASNKYMESFQHLDWRYLVAIIISFAVLLLTYDAVSGEKEIRTLAATLSNPISRGTLLFGKYLSVVITSMLVLIPGIALSLIILLLSGTVVVGGALLAEVAGFMAVVAVFVSCMAALGLLASVITGHSNVSLLVCLCLWLGAVVIVPNAAVFLTNRLYPIDSSDTIQERTSKARQEINANAPPGSWSSSGNNPFFEGHELRANNQMNLMLAEKRIKDAWNNDLFYQFNGSRKLAAVSPVSLFESLCEAVVGGGYGRLQKTWDDIRNYQSVLLTWFKEIDANDEKSPHWYNPVEAYSTTRKGVSWETVPQFVEQKPTLAERFTAARLSLALLIIYTALAFALSFVLFLRYDVR